MKTIFRNLPNILTVLRMLAVPVFIYFMLENQITIAIIIFMLAALTDIIDGFFARKYDLITTFGKIADPLADKLMQLAALFTLSLKGWIPSIIFWLVLGKELSMILASIYLIKKKYDTSSKWFGKLTSFLLFVAIILTLFRVPEQITTILLWCCVLMAIFTLLMYARNSFKAIKDKESEDENLINN
ncbi:MAG: CDP-diacylglycerol--glycerol-3-phosphate 3-phosphatidyltransferase [Acetivibrionales bacterium]|jgi:cardiolipin synthase|nr:CDP-diacylglycerol--glycerol-3-phosphate 3-phosphatidyltransferase [Clostridiaceae bacterium]